MDISTEDYSPILDAIGTTLVQKKGIFTLDRAPTGQDDMIVKIIHSNRSETVVQNSDYIIEGKTLKITDVDFLLTLSDSDSISINYQPKTAY